MYRIVLGLSLILTGCFVEPRIPSIDEQMEAKRLIDQGSGYLLLDQLDKAQASYEVALDMGDYAAAIDGLGCIAFMRKDYKKAETYFRRAYELDPSYTYAVANLALLYDVTGRSKDAQALFERAIEEDPKNYKVRNNYGAFVYDYLGGTEKAKARARVQLLRAQSLKDDAVVHNNLERLE